MLSLFSTDIYTDIFPRDCCKFSNLVQWGRKLDFCSANGAAKNSLIRRKKYQNFLSRRQILQVKCTSYSGLSHAETVLQYSTIEVDKQKTQIKSCEPVPLKSAYPLQFQPCRVVFPSCRRRLLEQMVHSLPAKRRKYNNILYYAIIFSKYFNLNEKKIYKKCRKFHTFERITLKNSFVYM
jgi:hypothetical protein